MAVTIGGADGGYSKKKTFKIKDGDNVYRILPSLGFNGKAPDGRPFKFWNVHFGYKTPEGKIRVFQSPEVKNRDTKMVEKNDPAKERIEKFKAALEAAKTAKNKAQIDLLAPLVSGQKPMYNMDNNHHCNAINEQGEIGVLKIRHKCKLALDAVIKSLRAKGIEPLGADNGRFFVINRTGTALETTFTVTVKKKLMNIEGVGEVEQDIVHKLTPDIIARLEAEAADLDSLFLRPTSEEVARIVAESDVATGKSPNIEEILKGKSAEQTGEEQEPEGEEPPMPTLSNATPTVVANPLGAPLSSAVTTPLAQPAQSLSQAPPAQPAPTQAAPAVSVQAMAAPKAAAPVSEMSDEEFLKSLGA
jgi:hypothetical protein